MRAAAKTTSPHLVLQALAGLAERDPQTILMNLTRATTVPMAVEELGVPAGDVVDELEEVVDVDAAGEEAQVLQGGEAGVVALQPADVALGDAQLPVARAEQLSWIPVLPMRTGKRWMVTLCPSLPILLLQSGGLLTR